MIKTKTLLIKYQCILLTLILIFSLRANGQTDSVILTGRLLDTTKNGDSFTCKIFRPGTQLYGQVEFIQPYSAVIKDNCFRLSLPSLYNQFDVTFCITDSRGRQTLLNGGNGREMSYTLQKKDHLQLLVRLDGSINFSGNNVSRLRCQQHIMSLGYLPLSAQETLNDLMNTKQYKAYYNISLLLINSQITMKNDILLAYKDSIPEKVYRRLSFDILGQSYFQLFTSLHDNHGDTEVRKASKLFLSQIETSMPATDSSAEALSSPYYTYALLLKTVNDISYSSDDGSAKKVVLSDLLNRVSNNYKGMLKDRLILLSFLSFARTDPNADRYLNEAFAEMKSGESKDLLIEWSKGMRIGSPSYSFDLPDENGKRFTLNDFRGKVIVADFWFTGCEGCLQIPPAMGDVCKKYSRNKKVIFLSINVDRKKVMWDIGLKSGQYTIPGSIHLSLFGLGNVHPFLKYYNYDTFPSLLVIGPNGETVSAFAPDPRVDNGKKLIEMIESQLNNEK